MTTPRRPERRLDDERKRPVDAGHRPDGLVDARRADARERPARATAAESSVAGMCAKESEREPAGPPVIDDADRRSAEADSEGLDDHAGDGRGEGALAGAEQVARERGARPDGAEERTEHRDARERGTRVPHRRRGSCTATTPRTSAPRPSDRLRRDHRKAERDDRHEHAELGVARAQHAGDGRERDAQPRRPDVHGGQPGPCDGSHGDRREASTNSCSFLRLACLTTVPPHRPHAIQSVRSDCRYSHCAATTAAFVCGRLVQPRMRAARAQRRRSRWRTRSSSRGYRSSRTAPPMRSRPSPSVAQEGFFQPGQIIVTQGTPGQAFYLILSGRVEILRDGVSLGALRPGRLLRRDVAARPGAALGDDPRARPRRRA